MRFTLPHSHWVKAEVLFLSVKRPGRETDIASPIVLRLRMCGVTPPQPHMTSRLPQGQLHFISLSKSNNPFSTEARIKEIKLLRRDYLQIPSPKHIDILRILRYSTRVHFVSNITFFSSLDE